ncbi:hypothetical protein FB565_003315 [Actinoplanes lutulentus]|uniref:hypothetical protein n=1 Tax=Actinoplanes lutulentus TaxID=1287878 RepID=UPI000DBA6C87|nr:hypothetical protein [Actinoplanes lutulentus]MBB2943586.1 hypothetical protein [Actinoplanes lutulentus]
MLIGRLARAAALACSGAVVALAQLHLPDESFWTHREWLQWTAVTMAAGLVLYEAAETTVGLARPTSRPRWSPTWQRSAAASPG